MLTVAAPIGSGIAGAPKHLARRVLARAGLDRHAEQDLLDLLGQEARAVDRGLGGERAETGGGDGA